MIRSMDLAIRAARRLGIDRLGSAQDDERAWRNTSSSQTQNYHRDETLPHHSYGDWAAATFARRDARAREIARSHWWMLVSRDWGATRQMGSYLIYPSSFTTCAPQVYAIDKSDSTSRKVDLWYYLTTCSEISQRFNDICVGAAAQRSSAESLYDQILDLDRRLRLLLDSRPYWLQSESCPAHIRKATVVVDVHGHQTSNTAIAAFVSTLLWHRLFIIVREIDGIE